MIVDCKNLREYAVKVRQYALDERPLNVDEVRNLSQLLDMAIANGDEIIRYTPINSMPGWLRLSYQKFKDIVGFIG